MIRAALMAVLAALLWPAAAHAQDADRRVSVSPYIEAGQVLVAELDDDGDVLTYSTIAVGIDAVARTRRVEVQVSYRFEQRISWDDDLNDGSIHSGLARGALLVAPGLTVEGGAIATRGRSDIRGAAPGNLVGNVDNIAQIFSAYAGPTLEKRVGPANLNALYRFGYTKVESPGFEGVPGGLPPLDNFDESTSHLALASIGTRAGTLLPVGLTLSGAWQREDASQLDQRFEGKYLRGDVVVPVSRTVALVAGAGYENIRIDQRAALIDPATGFPVTDRNGRFVTDPASPRLIAFDFDGIFWDAGVVWKPSPRTVLEARVGERYDSLTYIGSLSWQTGPGSGLQVGVYDGIQGFGRQLNSAIAELPTSFVAGDDAFGDNFNGCVLAQGNGSGGIGGNGANGALGGCLNSALQSIATANFRARGFDVVYAINRAATRVGFGGGYARRRFYAPDLAQGFTVDGTVDESAYIQAFAATALDSRSGLTATVYFNYYSSGIAFTGDVTGAGAQASYSRSFGRLGATAALGLYSFDQEGGDSDLVGQALVGLGYRF
ncbi:hypothetical protein GO308_03945 [Sphingomonas sp. SFZ2018-12]|uniref:hypothetical protein n=1 Tax=Sphingomonas sp. SFZ2018-12 TaxID=2683197 RepID=UPI001F10D3C6|nr:hypothetical protein [Sphingomonas sp. SFZ2018-12]MCH4892264.1 hypothetical protein [Sphingomonas sp. SFZ2018-12]